MNVASQGQGLAGRDKSAAIIFSFSDLWSASCVMKGGRSTPNISSLSLGITNPGPETVNEIYR